MQEKTTFWSCRNFHLPPVTTTTNAPENELSAICFNRVWMMSASPSSYDMCVCVLSPLIRTPVYPFRVGRRSHRGHTGGSHHRSSIFFSPPPYCGALALIFRREKGPGYPFPSSIIQSRFVYDELVDFHPHAWYEKKSQIV